MTLFFITWLAVSWLVGYAAAKRGRSGPVWFFIALLASPLIGGLILAILPKQGAAALPRDEAGEAITPETHVRCPECRELVRADARKCKHCGTALMSQ